VKGSGIANTCPVISGGSTDLKDLKAGAYSVDKFCMEPTAFDVKEESQFKGGADEFVKTKLMTRLTYTLDQVRAIASHDGPLDLRAAATGAVRVERPAGIRPFGAGDAAGRSSCSDYAPALQQRRLAA
jgi:photosystem II oxygen-evolving enhancer protein 1